MHTSIPLDMPIEFINVTPLNPLISKCQIKVCYVGDDPNRNKSIITKDTARILANSLPGSPIVGYFNDHKGDYEEHSRSIKISNGKFVVEDMTKPYGFVDLNAKVWFQKYLDDGQVEREYLVTEGYLWTGQYPECQRIVDRGNNQSMELDQNTLDAFWTRDGNGKPQFFIINEAIVSKLCVLGEDCEPCFEGSNITPVQFSFDDGFKTELLSMMKELKEYLKQSEGGTQVFTKYAVKIGDSLWSALYSYIEKTYADAESGDSIYRIDGIFEDGEQKFAVLQNRTDMKYHRLDFSMEAEEFAPAEELVDISDSYEPSTEPQFALTEVEAFETEFKKKKDEEKDKEGKSDNPKKEDTSEGDSSKDGKKDPETDPEDKKDPESKDDDDDEEKKKKKKTKFSLEELQEIPEYAELATKYSQLESDYNAVVAERDALTEEIAPLRTFRNEAEKEKKQAMIDSFCMLSDEDKKDVVDNIDTYSLDDIEAKLSIICVRNKVSFNLDDDDEGQKDPTVYNLNDGQMNEATPAWIKAAMEVAKSMK